MRRGKPLKRTSRLRKKRRAKKRDTVDKTALHLGERTRTRDKKYRKWIERQPCCTPGHRIPCHGDVIAAHYRIGSRSGSSLKPCDSRTLPLCDAHHRLQHGRGERTFWAGYDPEAMIMQYNQLYKEPIP